MSWIHKILVTKIANARRYLAAVLAMVLVVTNCQVASFAVNSDTIYSESLGGWKVRAVWNETLTTDYTWTAVENVTKQPKINVSYRINHADKEYPVGSIQFTVPGIGNISRNTTISAQTAASEDGSEWLCNWDNSTDTYTFGLGYWSRNQVYQMLP